MSSGKLERRWMAAKRSRWRCASSARFTALSGALVLLTACGSDNTTSPAAPPPKATPSIVSLEVTGTDDFPVLLGETAQLQVTAVLPDNSRQAVDGALVAWRSSNYGVATVSGGLVTGVEPGNVEITATYGGASTEVPVPVRISPTARGKVRVIYAAPEDRPFRADVSLRISQAIVHAQSWFRRELGGLTFELHDTTPEFCQMTGDSEYYSHGDLRKKVIEGMQHCAAVAHETPGTSWFVFVDAQERCGERHELGTGHKGLAIVPRHDLELLVNPGTYETCNGTRSRTRLSVYGGFSHELAHTFGVPHPPGCDELLPHCDYHALMHTGYFEYPDTYLRPDEKELLMRSRFFRGVRTRAAGPERFAIQGVVRDSSGAPMRGIRVSAMSDHYWNWAETGPDGAFSIGVPDEQSGPFLVSAHAGETADCNWLGYHGSGGLHSARKDASLVTVGSGDAEAIEVTLPFSPDEGCNMDRMLNGTVLGPDGRPLEGVLIAFHQFYRTARDGAWESRHFEGWWAERLARPLTLRFQECPDTHFYYTQDGFTERSYWAKELERRFEIGPLGFTGIEVKLPASPAQLCQQSRTQ